MVADNRSESRRTNGPRLVAVDGKIIAPVAMLQNGASVDPEMDSFAFVFFRHQVVGIRNGQFGKVGELLLQLAECMRKHCDDDEARTAAALNEPRALL